MPGEITALISAFCYALSYIYLNRAQSKGEAPDNGLFPVLLLSSLSLGVFYLASLFLPHEPLKITNDWWISLLFCIAAGITWNFLGRMTLYASIARIGATRGVVIKSAAPIVTISIAVIFLHEDINRNDIFGFILMLGSILLLFLERNRTDARSPWRTAISQGILLGLVSILFQSVGHVFRKLGMDSIGPFLGANVDLVSATALYTLYLLWHRRLGRYVQFYRKHMSWDVVAASLLSAVGALTFFVATANSSISNVSMIVNMEPVFMPILSLLFFRQLERLTWLSYLSNLLVIAGVFLVMLS